MRINLLLLSGGKDSTAMLIYAIKQKTPNLMGVFCDTGNEHPLTYEYLEYLNREVHPIKTIRADFTRGIQVRRKNLAEKWLKDGISQERIDFVMTNLNPTGNPFLDLCLLKSRFPSTMARFCTQELKIFPVEKQIILPALKAGDNITSWQGVRADESPHRAKLRMTEHCDPGLVVFRPLLHWSAKEVFDYHDKHGVKPNPLYKMGMGRVGCMPCIMARKQEINEISVRFPDEIDRIERWETLVGDVSKRGTSTFFAQDKTPQGRAMNKANKGVGIRDVVEWASTDRGGKQWGFEYEEPPMCSSLYGLCE